MHIHIDFGEGGGNPYFGDLNSYKIFLEIGTIFFSIEKTVPVSVKMMLSSRKGLARGRHIFHNVQ